MVEMKVKEDEKIRQKWWMSWKVMKGDRRQLTIKFKCEKDDEWIYWMMRSGFFKTFVSALFKMSRKSLTQEWRIKGFPKTLGKGIGNRHAQSSVVFALLTCLHITRCCRVYNAWSVWLSQLLNNCTTKRVWENSLAKTISTAFLKWGESNQLPGSQKFQYFVLIMVHSHLMLSQFSVEWKI
jgi:hypothetical protein